MYLYDPGWSSMIFHDPSASLCKGSSPQFTFTLYVAWVRRVWHSAVHSLLQSSKYQVAQVAGCSKFCRKYQEITTWNLFEEFWTSDSTLCNCWAQVYFCFEGAAMLRAVRSSSPGEDVGELCFCSKGSVCHILIWCSDRTQRRADQNETIGKK